MKKIPVFFINGMLDSGKTTFIIDTLENDIKERKAKTLLLVCEEGEVEYEEELLTRTNTYKHVFESQEEWDYKLVEKLIKQEKPDRVVIEMNGMWDLKMLQFPRIIEIVQLITFIDGSTFSVYFNNMRQKFNDMIKQSHVVCFTKVDGPEVLAPYQTALKLINNNCEYMIMDENLRAQDAFEEPLPYDIEQDVIKIEERDYGTFYIDTFDHKERYDGKTVEYDIMVVLSEKLPPNSFIAGRFIMNCCADDIQLFGFLADDTLGLKLKDRQWIHLKANISYEWSEEYNEEELVLKPISIDLIEGPKDKVLDLTK